VRRRYPWSYDYSGLIVTVMVAGTFTLFVWLCVRQHEAGERCEARGGTWYCGYKSSCLCLAKGVVLP